MKILKRIYTGISIACTIYLLFGLFGATSAIQQTIICVYLLGGIAGLLSLIYSYPKLSLLTKTLLQFLGTLCSFLVIAYLDEWFTLTASSLLWSLLLFLTVFFGIWSAFYFNTKSDIRKINQKLPKH